MKINSLKLRGFTGIKKGLGVDEISLDLSGLSGLTALSGPNGSGKTTILESLQPYRTLASRKKALQYHVFTRDACKELDFDFQGDNYKTKVVIDCQSGRQEGYLWKNGESVLDGKVRNYDPYIENLFGSEELFFNSVFCAQNASKLSDLTTGKLKELFSEFLRLDRYIAYEAATKRCISRLGSQGTVYDSQADNIRNRLTEYGDLESQLTRARSELDAGEEMRSLIIREIIETDAAIMGAKEAMAANQVLSLREKDFRDRIVTAEKTILLEKASYGKVIGGIRAEIQDAKGEITSLSQTLEQKDQIEQAVILKKTLAVKIEIKAATITKEVRNISNLQDQIRELEHSVNMLMAPNEGRVSLLREQVRGLKAQTAALDRRDPECSSTICGFIKTALEAEKALPGLEKQLSEAIEAVKEKRNKNDEFARQTGKEVADLKGKKSDALKFFDGLQTALADYKKQYVKVSELADRQGDLREALARKEAAENRKKVLTARGLLLKGEYGRQADTRDAELANLQISHGRIITQLEPGVDAKIRKLESDKSLAEEEKEAWDSKITDWGGIIQALQKDITERTVLETQLAEISEKASGIQVQTSEWDYLRKGVSKDGFRALEIAAVSPSISANANQILFNTFGPAYSVKLRTQDDEGREVLDILVIEEDGSTTFLDNLSGGEQVWSLKALKLAMTLVSKEKSGKALETCFADEEDGALDVENAQSYIHLYKSFMEAGEFNDCFFISHRPECVAMANHQLKFGNGIIRIN